MGGWGRSGEEIYEERKSARTKATRPLGPRAGVAASTVLSGVTVGTGVEQLLSCTTPHDVVSHGREMVFIWAAFRSASALRWRKANNHWASGTQARCATRIPRAVCFAIRFAILAALQYRK